MSLFLGLRPPSPPARPVYPVPGMTSAVSTLNTKAQTGSGSDGLQAHIQTKLSQLENLQYALTKQVS